MTGTESLEITAHDNLLSYLTSDVSGTGLTLGTKSHTNISPSKDPLYKLTVKDLNSIALGGSGAIAARDIHTDRLKVVLGGSGDISADGTADEQDILIGGSGAYHAPDLKSKTATITIGGSGDADLNATEKLNVTIAGSGSVTYSGEPTVTPHILGSGTVKEKIGDCTCANTKPRSTLLGSNVEIEHFPPSGPWVGYYLYGHSGPKHHMHLSLTFDGGSIRGDGTDDIGPFLIQGVFNSSSQEATWTKSYVGMHTVEYRGLYDGRSICGDWSLIVSSGAFWIWPSGLHEKVTDSIEEELDQPAHEVHLSVRIA